MTENIDKKGGQYAHPTRFKLNPKKLAINYFSIERLRQQLSTI